MRWKENEIEFLRENYPKKIPLEKISKKLGRSIKSIHRMSQRMNLSRSWVRFNKSISKQPKKIVDRRYYEKNKKDILKRRKERLRVHKKEILSVFGGKCIKCGYKKCIAALEFHHGKSDKENNVKDMIKNYSKEKALKEAKKCIILCANCHRELHYGSVV
tara:strand:- start:102 stop:581 length:480 start_codon:yes stop_codon:yes gene_type:complete